MYKLFMVMCFMVNGEVQCTNYDDSTGKVYEELSKCEQDAAFRFYSMTDVFARFDQPYEKIEIGCIQEESNL